MTSNLPPRFTAALNEYYMPEATVADGRFPTVRQA